MKKIQYKYNSQNTNQKCFDDSFIHSDAPINKEYTLCGLAFEGESINVDFIGQCFIEMDNNKKITCPQCIAIIKHVTGEKA